jgi:biopolymer transport protein ExbD
VRRRRVTRYAELTSLLDVLFILLFASLIQAAGMVEGAAEGKGVPEDDEQAPSQPETITVDAGPPADAAPPPSHRALRQRALEELMKSMGDRKVIYVRISSAGTLTAIERSDGGQMRRQELDVALLERVPDPDVEVVYVGDRSTDLRLCTRVRVTLGLDDLVDRLVVVAADASLGELPVALVDGLRRDQERCFIDERGVSVLVTP